jgi:hypothetical protein
MAKNSPALGNFNAGQLSPEMDGRVDVDKYQNGCHALQNFIPLVQGPARRRPGTKFIAAAKSGTAATYLRRFEFNETTACIIEFGDYYCRFYQNGAKVTVSGLSTWNIGTAYSAGSLVTYSGTNYWAITSGTGHQPDVSPTYWYAMPADGTLEIQTPWQVSAGSIAGINPLQFVQSADVLYVAGGSIGVAPYQLTRLSGFTVWSLTQFAPTDGPFLEGNSSTTTMQISGVSGSVVITSSSATFAATDVGRLVRIAVQSQNVKPWETNKSYTAGTLVRYSGKTYAALNNATSGSAPPVHLWGNAYDGQVGVQWAYQDSGYGVAQITTYTNSTHVTATVITNQSDGLYQFPQDLQSNPSTQWSLGAWSNTTEWPRAIAFFDERLFWGGKIRWWGSVPSLYTSYAQDFGGVTSSDCSVFGILSAQDVNNIVWMSPANLLLIGTEGGEFGLGPVTTSNPLGPDNVHVVPQSKMRSASVEPVLIGTSVFYVQRSRRKLMAADYNFYLDRYDSLNQNRLAHALTATGITQVVWQAEPYETLWAVRSDGALLSYTYDRQDNVTGWAIHYLGNADTGTYPTVKSVAVIPAADGLRDELWLLVQRSVNGAAVQYVEVMQADYTTAIQNNPSAVWYNSTWYVDCGATVGGHVKATSFSGFSHLEGQTVQVLADGALQPPVTVSGGTITIAQPAYQVIAGLRYESDLTTMRIEGGADVGTAQGKTKRVVICTFRVQDTIGGTVGMDDGNDTDYLQLTDPSIGFGMPSPVYTGDIQMQFPGDWEADCRITVSQTNPLPMTVVAIFPNIIVNEPT